MVSRHLVRNSGYLANQGGFRTHYPELPVPNTTINGMGEDSMLYEFHEPYIVGHNKIDKTFGPNQNCKN